MRFVIASIMLIASVSVMGCQEKKPEVSYDSSDVERYLDDHPELKEEPANYDPANS
ncbi:hypothetical protein [Novipirellula aureliae]|nr:hypothetical protein [Novipirellula aureliae]